MENEAKNLTTALPETRVCSNPECGLEKPLSEFYFRKDTGKYRAECKSCILGKQGVYYQENRDEKLSRQKEWYQENKEDVLLTHKEMRLEWTPEQREKEAAYQKQYAQDNVEELVVYRQQYYQENREEIAVKTAIYRDDNKDEISAANTLRAKARYNDDPAFRLRSIVSVSVRTALKRAGSSKNNVTVLNYLPQSIETMFFYLEKLFSHPSNLTRGGEVWMNWKNQGVYDPKVWNDNDPTTWRWQLDHIIPQSDLPYTSMEEDNFKRCWELENLRPLSARQNVLDGTKRTRHKKDEE